MAIHRTAVALLLVSLVASALAIGPNDVLAGEREEGEHLLIREFVAVPPKFLRTVSYRKTFPGDNYSRITRVNLIDGDSRGHSGGTASIVNGGPGFNYVTVSIDSFKGKGIDFIIEIFGKK